VFSIFKAIHSSFSESIISTRSKCVVLSGSIFFISPETSASICIKFQSHHHKTSLNSPIIVELFVSTHISSFSSFATVFSIESHFSTLPQGNTYFCHFL